MCDFNGFVVKWILIIIDWLLSKYLECIHFDQSCVPMSSIHHFAEAAASEMRYGKATFSVYPGTNQMLCRSLAFYPHFKTGSVNVQLSPARSQTMVGPMMEASSVWVEETAKSGFTACVQTSGTIKISRVRAPFILGLLMNFFNCVA